MCPCLACSCVRSIGAKCQRCYRIAPSHVEWKERKREKKREREREREKEGQGKKRMCVRTRHREKERDRKCAYVLQASERDETVHST